MVEYANTTRRLEVPFLPRPILKDRDVSLWGNTLTVALSRAFDQLATRIEELATTESGTGKMPAAGRSRNFFYDNQEGDLYFDDGSWQLVASLKGADHTLDTTNFDSNLSAADDTVQKAFDTLDDMAAGGGPYHIDGGHADSIYTGDQLVDGGGA